MSSTPEINPSDISLAMQRFGLQKTSDPADSSKARPTETRHGLETPEATPGVDEARIRADEKRKQQEDKEAAIVDARNSIAPVSKPPHPSLSDDDVEVEATEDGKQRAVALTEKKKGKKTSTGNRTTADQKNAGVTRTEKKGERAGVEKEKTKTTKACTEVQQAAVDQVLKGQFAFQILGLESGSRNEAGASKSWKQLKVKLHPDKNPHPKAEEAFKKAQAAAETFGVEIQVGEEFLDDEGNSIEADGDEGSVEGTASEIDGDSIDTNHPVLSEDADVEMEDVRSTGNIRKPHKGASRTHTGANHPVLSRDADVEMEDVESTRDKRKRHKGANRTHTDADQTQPTALEWKWTTGQTAAGERIMAYRKQGTGYRCVVETKKGSPVFTFKSGSECGALEFDQYLKMGGIWKLSPADKQHKWTKEYRGNFISVDWVAYAPRKSHNPFSKSRGFRAPEVLCGVTWTWGFESLSISELRRVISQGSADARIDKLCEANGHISPEEAEEVVRIQMSTKMMPIKQEDNSNVWVDAGSSKVNERRQKRNSKKPTDSSVEDLLTQMDRRMAKMEDAVTPLALVVAALVKETGLKINK